MIDTFSILYENTKVEEVRHGPHLIKISGDYRSNGITLQVKPSLLFPNTLTSNIYDLIKSVEDVNHRINKKGIIKRIDFAYDSIHFLKSDRKLYLLFVACMALTRKDGLDKIFMTETIFSTRNIKIRNTCNALTVYDSSDKKRAGNNLRIENRFFKLSINNENIETQISFLIKQYCKELSLLDKNVDKIEEYMVSYLYELWKDLYGNRKNLHEFVAVHDKFFLTRRILVEFFQKINYSYKIENFIIKHNNSNRRIPLIFSNKTQLDFLRKNIIKDMKNILKR